MDDILTPNNIILLTKGAHSFFIVHIVKNVLLRFIVNLVVAFLAHAFRVMGSQWMLTLSSLLVVANALVACLAHEFGAVRLVQMSAQKLTHDEFLFQCLVIFIIVLGYH